MSTSSASSEKSSVVSMDEFELKQRMAEIEQEQAKLAQIQKELTVFAPPQSTSQPPSPQDQAQTDARSVYVGNVDYSCTTSDIEQHFLGCGAVARVTIPRCKFTGTAKGFAYIEFEDADGRVNSLAMSDSLLKGRQIKVVEKRTNRPGLSTTDRAPRLNRVARGHGGVIVKYVPVYGGARGMRGSRNLVKRNV